MTQNNSSNTSSKVSCTVKPQSPTKPNNANGKMAACSGSSITATFGVFFDGTGNNKFNTAAGLNGSTNESISYKNSLSNVAKGWRTYTGSLNGVELKGSSKNGENFNIYVEGIGTSNGEDDHDPGMGLGVGHTGIKPRVKFAGHEVARNILDHDTVDKTIVTEVELTFDVFGFSRGAAAARHFIHLNSEEYPVPYSANPTGLSDRISFSSHLEFAFNHFINFERKIKVKIIWRFAGLYETVSSYGPIHTNDISNLGLMTLNEVKKIVHIRALDEYRKNFAFTKSTQGNTQKLELLGVHSDIGGGYVDNSKEDKLILYRSISFLRKNGITTQTEINEKNKLERIKKQFKREGWYREQNADGSFDDQHPSNNFDNITIEPYLLQQFSPIIGGGAEYEFQLIGSRKSIKNTYSQIPLYLMTKLAIENGVPFSKSENKTLLNKINSDTILNKVLSIFNTLFIPLSNSEQLLKDLRYGYLHWSSVHNKQPPSLANYIPGVLRPHVPVEYKEWFLRKTIG